MWTCPYCGCASGMYYHDSQLQGMLCLHPECGRFDEWDEEQAPDEISHYYSDT